MSQGFVGDSVLKDVHREIALGSTAAEVTSECKASIIQRAKEILAGRFRPPAINASPEIDAFLIRELQGKEPQPDPAAVQRIIDRVCLETQYGGQLVAWCAMTDGRLAVLATGSQEVEALLLGLSDDELANVVVFQPNQF
jgi:hypothetical protein